MTIQCDNLDDLLLEGDTFSMQMAARHASTCASCADKIAAWSEISTVAHGMQTTWRNDMLWPRIERSIRAEERHQQSKLWQIAAAIVMLAGLGVFAWKANDTLRTSQFDQRILQSSAVDEVEKAEKAHLAAIDQLEKSARPKLEAPVTPLLVSYKEKLMLLDDAIAECQTNIDRNRENAHLRKQLLAIYTEKQRTLQEVLREGNHVSNQ
ncbi:MAG: hypothetical protein M3041_13855 [Acidobacteriota bacterium]|nr:hypothetical protein [Acidobacteriota bacterium]